MRNGIAMPNPTRSLIRSSLCAVALLGACCVSVAQPGNSQPAAPLLPIKPEEILSHATRSVEWYRGLESVEQLPGTPQDLLARDRLRDESVTAVRLAFDFGQASAAILSAGRASGASDNSAGAATGFTGQLDQITDRVSERIKALQAQESSLDAQISHARGRERTTLVAQRGDVTAALALVREVQTNMQDMQRFESYSLMGESSGEGGLGAQLAELQKSVPEVSARRSTSSGNASAGTSSGGSKSASSGGSASAGATTSATTSTSGSSLSAGGTAVAFRPESAGILALGAEWLSLHNTRRQLSAAIKQTGALIDDANKLRRAVTGAVRGVMREAFAPSANADAKQLNAQKAVLEAGAADFKKLSTALVPIGDQGLTLESAQGTLREWDNQVALRSASVSRYFVLRIGVLLASIAVVLVISEIWRRATFRYLRDPRRRRQFLVLRRVAVGFALTVLIVFGLISELGSVATYVGFVTAGIAVAMQNVILAIVAYFFLIGRYGVRVGDRITLAGVTGRVVDIGLIRIYLMELAGSELHSTGRIVVLSNAVLFQPTALFKQIPGAEYVWHTITLTLAATADVIEANRRLKAAADEAYAKYRPGIERQYAAVQKLVDWDTSTPQPEVRVRWAESGLECSVRYPVEPEHSAAVDQQMLNALRDALAKDPPLQGPPAEGAALKLSDS